MVEIEKHKNTKTSNLVSDNSQLPPQYAYSSSVVQQNGHHHPPPNANGKSKDKLPQRRNSFFGSLFSSNSNKNMSSGNLPQQNGYSK